MFDTYSVVISESVSISEIVLFSILHRYLYSIFTSEELEEILPEVILSDILEGFEYIESEDKRIPNSLVMKERRSHCFGFNNVIDTCERLSKLDIKYRSRK